MWVVLDELAELLIQFLAAAERAQFGLVTVHLSNCAVSRARAAMLILPSYLASARTVSRASIESSTQT